MNGSTTDRQLLQLVTAANVTTIAGVITTMEAIDGLLPNDDGLKWFNLLYLKVTRSIDAGPPAQGWRNPAWLLRLDVVFAGFYFRAIANWLQGSPELPSSWKALFEARYSPGIERIQFAVAGMNAHINHDLALALLATDSELGVVPSLLTPEHDDYEHVNDILDAVFPQALQMLATGVLGVLAQDSGKIGRLLAIWNIRAARDLAWEFANHLRMLDGLLRNGALTSQDQITGVVGRSLLALFSTSAAGT